MTDKSEPKKVEPLTESRQQLAEVLRNVWRVHIPQGVRPEDILASTYWAHVCRNYRMFDKIEALAEDGSWYVELLVTDCGPNFARVSMLEGTLSKLQPFEPESRATPLRGHTVRWAGVHDKYIVIRDADGVVLRRQIATKADAWTWLDNYGKSQAA